MTRLNLKGIVVTTTGKICCLNMNCQQEFKDNDIPKYCPNCHNTLWRLE